MASASNDLNASIEEHLTCSICYNLLREPKELDCPHVFCLQCLQQWSKKQQTVECPECRQVTIVPEEELVNLKTNLRLKNMVEEFSNGIKKQKASAPICPNHEGEKQHFFCVTCGVTVCHNCLVLDHERPVHEIKELKDICKTKKKEVMRKLHHVKREIEKRKTERNALEDAERNIEAAKDKTVIDIKEQVQRIVSSAEARGKELIACAERVCQEHKELLHEKQDEAKDTIAQLKNIQTTTQNVVDTAADHVYMNQHTSLVDEMDKLCITEHETDVPQDVGSLCFNPGTDPMTLSRFGDVMIHGSKVCGLKLVKEFGPFQYVCGIAVSKTDLIAVVDYKAKDVIIYRDVDGEYKRQFCLSSSAEADPRGKITEPRDVAITSEDRFLVVDSRRVDKIFSPSGEYENTCTLTGAGNRITTTPDDLIVTGRSTGTGFITVHQSGGELIRKHQVDHRSMVGIASNGKQIAFTSLDLGKVCAIDFVTGQLIWAVDMMRPIGICYEPTSNTLLVAGGSIYVEQSVIDQRSSTTGCLISRLASGLFNPWAMTVTHERKLVVADEKTVKVYELQ